jgi:hypothetical protein
VRKSFDDGGKKKIIEESVRTSSVGSRPEGSGLWPGHFVRRSFRAGSCCRCAIFKFHATSALDAIVNCTFNPVLDAVLAPEECYNQPQQKEEQLTERGASEAQAELSSFAAHA